MKFPRGYREGTVLRLLARKFFSAPDLCPRVFDPAAFIAEAVAALKGEVKGKAIIAASGGGDSTTAAALASRALGPNLLAGFVDTGLMREGEGADVAPALKDLGGHHRIVDAEDEVFAAL